MPDREVNNRSIGVDMENDNADLPVGKYYLFVIAIDHYDPAKGLAPLQAPVRDAARLTELLLDKYTFDRPAEFSKLPGYTNVIQYDSTAVKCLYNEAATRDAIKDHLQLLAEEVTENDYLLIYFAGHGDNPTTGHGQRINLGKLMPYDANAKRNASHLLYTELVDEFMDYVNVRRCRDILLILDCCYGGVVLGGLKNTLLREKFSRYALTSASYEQAAIDMLEKYSPFADTVFNMLSRNTAPVCYLKGEDIDTEVKERTELWINVNLPSVNGTPLQDAQYGPLAECGTTRFLFRLKDPDVPPADTLSKSLIKDLNFATQKIEIDKDFSNSKQSDLFVITTMCDSFNVHQMQSKVLLEHLKTEELFSFTDFLKISIAIDKIGADPWKVLAANERILTEGDIKEQCAIHLRDRLRRNDVDAKRPLFLCIGCNFPTGNYSREMISFCTDLQAELIRAKASVTDPSVKFNILFLVIGDTRKGRKTFFSISDFEPLIRDKRHVVVTSPVEQLNVVAAKRWHLRGKETIKSNNFHKLNVGNYFQTTEYWCIEEFVMKVSSELGVNQEELARCLWH